MMRRQPSQTSSQEIHKDIVIGFVEELEKAQQYFQLKEFLRAKILEIEHTSDQDTVAYNINLQKERDGLFSLLDENDIYHSVNIYINELKQRHYEPERLLMKRVDQFAVRDPFFYLLLQAREEGYVLDKEPEKEIIKIRKFAPCHYKAKLACRKPRVPVEERTVTVSDIPPDFTPKEIRFFFKGNGCISLFETESGPNGSVAHITFKELEGAKHALAHKPARKLLFSIVPERQPLYCIPLVVKPKSYPVAVPIGKTKDVSMLYDEAIAKYKEIRAECMKIHSPSGRPFKEEDYWIEWMGIEAFHNGGFALDGKHM